MFFIILICIMATVPIYKLSASVSSENDPVIRTNALLAGGLTNSRTKLLQFYRDGASVFVINADGSINSSGSITTNTAGIILPAGTAANAFTYYKDGKIQGLNQITYNLGANPAGNPNILYYTGSNYLNSLQIEGGYKGQTSQNQEASIVVATNLNKEARGYSGGVGPENLQIRMIGSGSAYFTMDPRSYNFSSSTRSSKNISGVQNTFHNILQIQDNSFYFWPTLYSYSTIGRGAGLGVGVIPPTTITGSSALKAALHIQVFSSSVAGVGTGNWNGAATGVQHRQAAIVVTYGSGSTGNPFNITYYVSSSGKMYSRNLGTGTVYTNGGIFTNVNPSDINLKNNIEPLSYGLNEVTNLNPITYYWNEQVVQTDFDKKKKFGFIAQEVQPYLPELVDIDQHGYYNLDVNSMIPILVKAVKDLKAEIEALKARLP